MAEERKAALETLLTARRRTIEELLQNLDDPLVREALADLLSTGSAQNTEFERQAKDRLAKASSGWH